MKPIIFVFFLLVVLSSCKNEVNNDTEASRIEVVKVDDTMAPFEWVLGDWTNVNSETQSFEHWEKAKDGSLVAYSITMRDQDTVFAERMKLYEEQGIINLYVETVGPEPNPIVFTQKLDAEHPFTFENERNPFPSQIVYTQPEKNKIKAWVAGFINDVPQRQEFFFERVIE